MTTPITISIPHKLGREQARERIERGAGQLAAIIPGALVSGHQRHGDKLAFTLEALGQKVAVGIDVMDDSVLAIVDLPPMLALFADKIRAKLLATGNKLIK